MSYVLSCCSTADLSKEHFEKRDINYVCFHFYLDEAYYPDDLGQTMPFDKFYKAMEDGAMTKTSQVNVAEFEEYFESFLKEGKDILHVTLSSGISGTWQALKLAMQDEPNVAVFDSKLAVGGVRFLVEEARRYENEPLEVIVQKLDALVPRIVIAAIPEMLDYLLAGGRLSRAGWMMGKLLAIHPVIGFIDGKVSVVAKKRGMKASLQYLADVVVEQQSDPQYGIIAAYTENQGNIEQVIGMTDPEYQKQVKLYDNLTPSIACHWGPNAFGYIFVKKAADRI